MYIVICCILLRPCECHSSGSYGIDCDDEGQCQCRSGVQGGRRCDQCGPGYYSIFDGCLGMYIYMYKD